MDHKQTTPGKRNYSGLDLEKNISPSGRGETFFLTFLFIELIDRKREFLSAGICRRKEG
jgi:hypothetical protein